MPVSRPGQGGGAGRGRGGGHMGQQGHTGASGMQGMNPYQQVCACSLAFLLATFVVVSSRSLGKGFNLPRFASLRPSLR